MATKREPMRLKSLYLPESLDPVLRKLCFWRSQTPSEWMVDAIRAAEASSGPTRFRITADRSAPAVADTHADEEIISAGVAAMRGALKPAENSAVDDGLDDADTADRLAVVAVLKECAPETLSSDAWSERTISAARTEVGDEEGRMTQKDLLAALLKKIEGLRAELDDAVGFAVRAGEWAASRHPEAATRARTAEDA